MLNKQIQQPSIYTSDEPQIRSLSCVWVCSRDEGLTDTLNCYMEVLSELKLEVELIVINNGLGIRAGKRLAADLESLPIYSKLVQFGTTCPESTALSTAFEHTSGDVLVLLPAYPQSDPQDIPRMLDAVRNGLDYCASWRSARVDAGLEQWKSKMFNLATRMFAGVKLHDINSGLRMMRREVVQDLPLYGDLHIYLPVLAARQGFRVGEVPVRHLQERWNPTDGRGVKVYVRRSLDLLTLFFLTRFTQKPFRFFGSIGTVMLTVGGLTNLFLAYQKLALGQDLANRPALVLATLLIVLGIQTFSIGLIGELIIFVGAGGFAEYRIEKIYENTPSQEPQQADQQPAGRQQPTDKQHGEDQRQGDPSHEKDME